MGSSFKKSDDTQETESRAYFRYARLYETGWEFRELYTCYNRSKFEVMHSLDVPERSRKLNVFMGWIIECFYGLDNGRLSGIWQLAFGNWPSGGSRSPLQILTA